MRMSNIITLFVVAIIMFACNTKKSQHPEYVEISGKVINTKSTEFSVYGMGGSKKIIPIRENGVFKDSLWINFGRNRLQLLLMEDKIMTSVYAENAADIYFEADANDFINTLIFKLDFADYNNYLNKKVAILSSENAFKTTWYRLSETEFNKKTETLKRELDAALKSFLNIPKEKVENETLANEQYIKRFVDKYKEENNYALKLAKGTMSPIFENYENFDGSKTSLSDFKGKYVYIDVWATWCGPCKAQIPYLEDIEKEYHGKNIVFVSMSVDKEKDYDKWRKMIEEKHMSGIQILAPNQMASEFTRAFGINSIPRFILIDPEGKIVDYDAPRPSNKEELNDLLSSLNI